MKGKLNADALKGFFIAHVEKIGFGLAVLLLFMLIYTGYSAEPAAYERTPKELSDEASSVMTHIANTTWTNPAMKEQRDIDMDLETRSKHARMNNSPEGYAMPLPWNKPHFPLATKRKDPELLSVIDLVATPGFAALAEAARPGAAAGQPNAPAAAPVDAFGAVGDVEVLERPLPELLRKVHELGFPPQGEAEIRGTYFVTLTGLVPVKLQISEYETALLDADDYDPERDAPRYVWAVIERQEVTAAGDAEPWVRFNTGHSVYERLLQRWAGAAGEIVPEEFTDLQLTSPIPPLVSTNFELAGMRHPRIPRAKPLDESAMNLEDTQSDDGDLPFEGPGRAPGNFGEGPAGVRPPGNVAPGHRPPPGGMRGERAHEAMASHERPTVDHVMFRYIDFGVEPGKSYRYRVTLWLEDPNNPEDLVRKPHDRTLDPAVLERIALLPKPAAGRRGTFWRETPASEPTESVSISNGSALLASRVEMREPTFIQGTRIVLQRFEPKAKIMALQWDRKQAMNVPCEILVERGGLVAATADTWAISPKTLNLEKLKSYAIRTNSIVLDIRGGDMLAGENRRDANPLTAPGEVLVIDDAGNLVVRRESDDFAAFRKYHFEEPKAEEAPVDFFPGPGGPGGPGGFEGFIPPGEDRRPPRTPR